MGSYISEGIASTTGGDLEISSHGDLKLADSYETVKAAINFLIKTDKGQYTPDRRIGCDLGTFIGGQMNPDVFTSMEDTSKDNITTFVMHSNDIAIDVMPIDHEVVGIFVTTRGEFLDSDGNLLVSATETLGYVYPYLSGEPQLVSIS